MEDFETCYRQRPKSWFKITFALNIFGSLSFKDMVVVNVNGVVEFTFLGIVRTGSVDHCMSLVCPWSFPF